MRKETEIRPGQLWYDRGLDALLIVLDSNKEFEPLGKWHFKAYAKQPAGQFAEYYASEEHVLENLELISDCPEDQ